MRDKKLIGVDLGGTKILSGLVADHHVLDTRKAFVPPDGTEQDVLDQLTSTIEPLFSSKVSAIGVGVPSVVDVENGIVYDVQNIPSWKEVALKEYLQTRYDVPVYINNDANCFALGEKYYGLAGESKNFIGLIVGTGIAAGIVIDDKLYNGHNCGAGEFGMIPYLDHHFEYYCSGQYFENVHKINGVELFNRASQHDQEALGIFDTFGSHLGDAVKSILYALDPELIVMGGSVSRSYVFFQKSMWESIRKFAYHKVPDRLTIMISSNEHIALLGAAALHLNEQVGKSNIERPATKPLSTG